MADTTVLFRLAPADFVMGEFGEGVDQRLEVGLEFLLVVALGVLAGCLGGGGRFGDFGEEGRVFDEALVAFGVEKAVRDDGIGSVDFSGG